jgi:hypothetical protein
VFIPGFGRGGQNLEALGAARQLLGDVTSTCLSTRSAIISGSSNKPGRRGSAAAALRTPPWGIWLDRTKLRHADFRLVGFRKISTSRSGTTRRCSALIVFDQGAAISAKYLKASRMGAM